MTAGRTDLIGHLRYRRWRIGVSARPSEASLALWLEACLIDEAGQDRGRPQQFGVVRVDDRGCSVHLSSGTAGLAVLRRSALECAIACRAVQVHLAARAVGHIVAVIDPSWLDRTDELDLALATATRHVLTQHTGPAA